MKVAESDGGTGVVYEALDRSNAVLLQVGGAIAAGDDALFGASSSPEACDPVAAGACADMLFALVGRFRLLGESAASLARAGQDTAALFRVADADGSPP